MARRGKKWKLREDYRPLLKRVLKLFPTVLAHVKSKRIALVGVTTRNCPWMGKIFGNRAPWSLFLDEYDYIIAFHSTQFDERPKSYRLWVMRHELEHIPLNGHVRDSKEFRRTKKHTIEDFKHLRKIYGLNLENVKKIYKGEEIELEDS